MGASLSEQLDLFDDEPGKHQRPGDAAETQIGSAYAATTLTGTWRRRVFREIALAVAAGDDGLTDEQIQDLLALNPSTERPRRVELVERGVVEDSERRRPTRSGRSAVVWCLTDKGQRIASRITELIPHGS